jgi:hypothetical protein
MIAVLFNFSLIDPLLASEVEPTGFDPVAGRPAIMDGQGAAFALIPVENRLLSGLELSARAAFYLDDNINQADGFKSGIEKDQIATIGASVAWKTGIRDFTVSVGADLSYDGYADHDEYSGFDYGLRMSTAYQGGPLEITGAFSTSSTQGVERFTGSLATREVTGFMTKLGYDISQKTSFEMSLSLADTRLDSSGATALQNSTRSVAMAGFVWQASPLSMLSLDLRATEIETESSGSRSTLGPTVSLNYQLTEKVDLDARIGVDFADASNAGTAETFVYGGIGLAYQLDPLWSFKLNFNHDVEAVQSRAGGFRDFTRLRFAVIRKIRDFQLDLGCFREDSTASGSGPAASATSQIYSGFDASLSYPLFGAGGSAAVFIRSHHTEADTPSRSWEGCQTGFSINKSF